MDMSVRTVLAATDLSRPAFAAARRAALIARDHGAKLELIHVIPDSFAGASWNDVRATIGLLETQIRDTVTENLHEWVVQLEAELGIRADALVVEGKPFAEIAARSESLDADLIVVGARGENVLFPPVLGTTAHRILRLARRPVLLVKQTPALDQKPGAQYGHAVIATDFAADAAHAARCTRRLFPGMSATLFNAYLVPFEAKLEARIPETKMGEYRGRSEERAHADLAAFAASTGWDHAPRVVRHGSPGVRIREYADEIAADLIVIGSEEVARLQTALLGSVSLDVIMEAKCDVLLARVPPPAT